MEGDSAHEGEGAIYLYKVIDREAISRDKAKALWREGKVSGLFNLPTEELFDACRDFGVKVDISDLKKAKEDGVVLRAKMKTLIERSVDRERELFELKTKAADLAQANLLQEQEFKRRLHDLTTRNKALTKERKKSNKEKTEAKEENTRLKTEVDRLKQQLEEARERERERDEKEKMKRKNEREKEKERKGKEREREKEGEVEDERLRLRLRHRAAGDDAEHPPRKDGQAERAKHLQIELKRERDLLKQMAVENQKLMARIQQLMIENEEMKLSSSITQTDHLNRQLLMSFMNTMDSLKRQEEEEKEQEDDGEGEWEDEDGYEANTDFSDPYGDDVDGVGEDGFGGDDAAAMARGQ